MSLATYLQYKHHYDLEKAIFYQEQAGGCEPQFREHLRDWVDLFNYPIWTSGEEENLLIKLPSGESVKFSVLNAYKIAEAIAEDIVEGGYNINVIKDHLNSVIDPFWLEVLLVKYYYHEVESYPDCTVTPIHKEQFLEILKELSEDNEHIYELLQTQILKR